MGAANGISVRLRVVAVVVAIVTLGAAPVWSGSGEEQVPTGPRPLALGGAFTAVAEGTDALYWNPAGLGRLRVSSVRVTNADLHGLGIQDNVITLVGPVGNRFGVGLEWHHSGYNDESIEDSLNRFSFAVGWRPMRILSVGSAVDYIRYEQAFEGHDQGRGSGWGFDVGVIAQPHRRVSVGASLRDAGGTTLEFDDGTTSRPFDAEFTVGAAVQAHRALLLVADIGRDAHAGAEVRVVDALTLRGGWTKDFEGLDAARWSAGVAVRFGAAMAEYTFQDHPMLDATHGFGLNLDFTLAPQLVEIHDAQLEPLFASFYKTYAVAPPGKLTVTSAHDEPLEVHVRIDHAQLLDDPTERTLVLKPGVVQEVELPIVFASRIVDVDETLPARFDVELSYVSSGRRRTDKRSVQTVIYERGTLDWSEGVGKAAAFVTPTHAAVDEFTRAIVQSTVSQDVGFLNRTTTLAVRLFDGLSACGLTYTPDPLNPYADVRGKPSAIDNIQYPAELLAKRTGDCDDSTVLYASMLANVGIRSAFVDVPGHIFLMFDTGIHARERRVLGVDPNLFVEREGTLWIPVETTSLGQPFHVAWQRGAALVREWEASERFAVVDVQQARQRYEAAVGAARVPGSQAVPDVQRAVVADYVGRDLAQLADLRKQHLDQTYLAGAGQRSTNQRLELARVFYLNRDYTRAEQELEQIPAGDRDAAYWTNLGNVRLAQGSSEAALDAYTHARGLDPADPGIALNRGLVLHMLGATAEAGGELQAAVSAAAGVRGAMNLLGLKSTDAPAPVRAGDDVVQMGLHRIETLLRQAAVAAGVATPTDSASVSEARATRIEPDAIAESVYWRSPAVPGQTTEPPGAIESVTRYPTVECPDRVRVQTEFAVQVSLTESLLTPEVQVVGGEGPALQVPVGVLDVVLSAPGFQFRDGVNSASITVRRTGDSTPALFHLTGLADKSPKRPLYVTFWHNGGFVGKVVRPLEVLAELPVVSGTAPPAPRVAQGAPLQILTDLEIPDLTLYVMDDRNCSDESPLRIMLSSPELAVTHDVFSLPDDARQWLRSQFARFAGRSGRGVALAAAPVNENPQATVDLMRGFGREVYKRYAPKAFKRAFWKLSDKLGNEFETIQIYANNPLLPWELMIPSRQDGSDEREFLGTQFRVANWHIMPEDGLIDLPPRDLTMQELVVIAPQYTADALPDQETELRSLESLGGYRRVAGTYESVRALFRDLPDGIVHFAGHGEVRQNEAGVFEYAIRLEDGTLDLLAWRGFAQRQSEHHPVFFLNACDVGQSNRIANFVDGWAPAVLEAGASAYISGIWPLGDRGAAEFASHFYRLLDDKARTSPVALADILRQTRRLFYETHDPTYLAYVYYGDAHFRVLKATQ